MTVPSNETGQSSHVGNGSADTYDYEFKITSEADLKVSETDTSGNVTVHTLTTDYTVTGVGDDDGGSITLVAGNLASGYSLLIEDEPTLEQTRPFGRQGAFFGTLHENAFDLLTRLTRKVQRLFDRCMQYPATGGNWDAESKAIENVTDPENDQDAVTKSWALSQNASLFTETGIVSVTAAKSLAATDKGKVLYLTGTAYALTIEPDATLDFAIGTMVLLNCNTSGSVTITRGSGVALNWFDGISVSDANRTLTVGGVACLVKRAADTWHIWGNGGLT